MVLAALLALLLQQTAVPAVAAEDRGLAHIRKALAASPAFDVRLPSQPATTPVFRVVIRGRRPDAPVWTTWTTAPKYAQLSMPLYHYEFLSQVTPQAYRDSALYPASGGIPVLAIAEAIGKLIDKAERRAAERAARKEVREGLEELARRRRAAGLDPR